MSLKIVSNELASLLNIDLKYLSTKTDKYGNYISYFATENINLINLLNVFLNFKDALLGR